jgi:adenine-specific DNA methylase
MLPLEAARYGTEAYGIDYSIVATLAGRLLADYPLRDWSNEPALPLRSPDSLQPRLLADVTNVLNEVSARFSAAMQGFYPKVCGKQPWGYLWAVTLPCQECGRRFPLVGSLALRPPNPGKGDSGQSFGIVADRQSGEWQVVVQEGEPTGVPTRVLAGKSRYSASGKVAVCPFCSHVHPKDVHTRLASERRGQDALLLAADLDDRCGKTYREVTPEEARAALDAELALANEPPFEEGLPAVPHEEIPKGNTWTVQATVYGARTYGDMCNARQTLGFVRLARTIKELGAELIRSGVSEDYASALCGYASAVMARKLRRATRGCVLAISRQGVSDIFQTESSLAFSYDYFEAGLGDGPGTWESIAQGTLAALSRQVNRRPGVPARITRGTALAVPLPDQSVAAVVTDPPYDAMIDYTDASDLFYVWLKRSLASVMPEFAFTADPHGVQEKTDEIIVKKGGTSNDDFRTRQRYDRLIARAFAESRRVVRPDGVVTIVFGHGEPEVWHRLLGAITNAGLVLTGSWPAKTEKGGKAGFSNIVTTLTMSCRPAPACRPEGRASLVEAEVRNEVKARVPAWEAVGLAPTDQRMASAGPAMEVVGRYSTVLDNRGETVDPERYLLVARRAVDEAAAIQIDNLPLETFDSRTRFALSWARLYGRSVAPKSEARWESLAADLPLERLKGILADADKGTRLAYSREFKGDINDNSAAIDVAMAMAQAWPAGLDAAGDVLALSNRNSDDAYLWAAMRYLSIKLPEADPDAVAWNSLLRNRRGVGASADEALAVSKRKTPNKKMRTGQGSLFD